MKLKLILLLTFVLVCNNVQYVQSGGKTASSEGHETVETTPDGTTPESNADVTDTAQTKETPEDTIAGASKEYFSEDAERAFKIENDLKAPVYPNAIYVILSPVANLGALTRNFFSGLGELGRSYAYPDGKIQCGEMGPGYQCELNIKEDGNIHKDIDSCVSYCEMREARCCQFDRTSLKCSYSLVAQETKLLSPEFNHQFATSCESKYDTAFSRKAISDYCGQDKNWKTGYICDRVQWYHSSYVTDLGTCAQLCRISRVQGCCHWDSQKFRCGVSKRAQIIKASTAREDAVYYCSAKDELPSKLYNTFDPIPKTESTNVQNPVVKGTVQYSRHSLLHPNPTNSVDEKKENFVINTPVNGTN